MRHSERLLASSEMSRYLAYSEAPICFFFDIVGKSALPLSCDAPLTEVIGNHVKGARAGMTMSGISPIALWSSRNQSAAELTDQLGEQS